MNQGMILKCGKHTKNSGCGDPDIPIAIGREVDTPKIEIAGVVKLVDTLVSGTSAARLVGSSPITRTEALQE